MIDLCKISDIKRLLSERSKSGRAKKFLGQHFLINRGVLEKIIEAANLTKEDTVIEVGPGLGTLTKELARHTKQVIAIEKDDDMIPLLKQNLEQSVHENIKNNVQIVHADALQYVTKYENHKVVSNIPYNISSPLLDHFIRDRYMKKTNSAKSKMNAKNKRKMKKNIRMTQNDPKTGDSNPPKLLVLMVQKEVARKVCAKPPDMNVLALHVQTFAEVEYLFTVKKGSFYPPPKVESAVIRITTLKKPRVDCDLNRYFDLIHRAFSQKRKQLKNSLGIPDTRRPEELSIEEWKAI